MSKSSDDLVAYRNFGPDEYAAFSADGNQFSSTGEFGRKQFWLEKKGLNFWRSKPKFSGEYTIKIRVPKSFLHYERMLDGHRALDFGKSSIQKLNKNFKTEWFEIRQGGQPKL